MVDIAQSIKCRVIAEGIEIREEYVTLQDMAIDFGQGYYFARPQSQPQLTLDDALFSKRKNTPIRTTKLRSNSLVKSLLTERKPLYNNETVNEVGERFQAQTDLVALPVINKHQEVVGIVWRDEFMTLYASRYGRDLHGRKPIQGFMDSHPIVAEADLPLKQLSQLITSQHNNQQHSVFVITENNHYRGIGSLMDLLRQITDLQITTARHANPLSGLPGNVPISEHINDALSEERDAVICYFDLDNFKPYNDYYGFGKGDKVISKLAKILVDNVDSDTDFVGHVGGDDFIVMFDSADWQTRCQHILDDFKSLHSSFYNESDLNNNGIQAIDRYGNPCFYPLLCISIGAVRLRDFDDIRTEADLTEHASKAKSAAKKLAGNSLFLLEKARLAS
jgi:GGDEF domain-containing protein